MYRFDLAYFLVIFSTCSVFTGTVQAMLREIFIGMGRCGGFRIDKNNVFSAAGENFGQLQHSKCFKNTFKYFFTSKCGNVSFFGCQTSMDRCGIWGGGLRPPNSYGHQSVWIDVLGLDLTRIDPSDPYLKAGSITHCY